MLQKHKTLFILILLIVGYLFSRSANLGAIPIFNDESTYIRYGIGQLRQPDHKPYSLTIGKEPLMPFLYALVGSDSPDLLLGARTVSILAGLIVLAGLYYFAFYAFGRTAAMLTGIFYILSPFNLFFDRLALMDCAVSTIAVWSLVLTDKLLKRPGWPMAFALGGVMGIGLWIKSSDFFYILLPVIGYGAYYFMRGDHGYKRAEKFGVALVIAFIIFEPLFSNPLYAEHLEVMKQYTYPVFSVFSFPVSVWFTNIWESLNWLFFYLTPPLFLLAVTTGIMFYKQKKLYLTFVWLVIPFFYEVLYAKLFTSRHVLLLTVPLLIMAGYGAWKLLQKNFRIGILICVIITCWCLVYDFRLIASPVSYPDMFIGIAKGDIAQYVLGSSSGYGVQEAITYLQNAAEGRDIVVVVRNDHGNPEDAVAAYLAYGEHTRVLALTDMQNDIQTVFREASPDMPIYYVTRGAYYDGLEKYIASEKRFYKPGNQDFVGVSILKH